MNKYDNLSREITTYPPDQYRTIGKETTESKLMRESAREVYALMVLNERDMRR